MKTVFAVHAPIICFDILARRPLVAAGAQNHFHDHRLPASWADGNLLVKRPRHTVRFFQDLWRFKSSSAGITVKHNCKKSPVHVIIEKMPWFVGGYSPEHNPYQARMEIIRKERETCEEFLPEISNLPLCMDCKTSSVGSFCNRCSRQYCRQLGEHTARLLMIA